MPPKQTKKITEDKPSIESKDSIDSLQKEWTSNVKEIISIREKLAVLEKHNEELVAKLWEKMNKNPTDDKVIIEAKEDEKKPTKARKVEPKEEPESDNEKDIKPKSKSVAKGKAKPEV